MSKNDKGSEYSFIKETIKSRPVNKHKLFRKTVLTIFSAVIFGLVACVTFLVLEPVISNKLYPEEITKVQFPEEEIEISPDEMLTENTLQEEIEANILQQIENTDPVERKITIEEYLDVYNQLYEIANLSLDFMVQVTCVTQNTNWLQGAFENEDDITGFVIYDNGAEYLVLAEANKIEDANEYRVTFQNGVTKPAALKTIDHQTGLGVFGIKHTEMILEEKNGIKVAQLGNSNSSRILGRPIIAIGSPQGKKGSLSYGIATSVEGTLNLADGIYKILSSDMIGVESAGGVFINLSGEVIGVITSKSMGTQTGNILSAIGISELKAVIEKLSNGEILSYAGIFGKDVTDEAHVNLEMPYGAYVSDVALQSPAMEAGITTNDVIVKVDNINITSFKEYRDIIFAKQPGSSVQLHVMRYSAGEYAPLTFEVILEEDR